MNNLKYEAPELIEFGEAGDLTNGCTGSPSDDCNCAKCVELQF